MKAFSIVGIVWAVLSFTCVVTWGNSVDYEASVGWGMFASIYLLAISIVVLVKAVKNK